MEHLTGPMRGTTTWIAGDDLSVTLSPGRIIHVAPGVLREENRNLVARLQRSGDTFEIEATSNHPIWVNGKRVRSLRLNHHDMIEFCETGPISRFVLYHNGQSPHATIVDVLSDAVAYVRSSHRPIGSRIVNATEQVLRRLARETTIFFRVGVIAVLTMLIAVAYQQHRISTLLREQIDASAAQVESFSRTLARAREDALTPGDLETLRRELGKGLMSATERLSELERRSTASARIIAQSKSSVVFLQGAYGFQHKVTGRMLRQVVSEDGKPLALPNGIPLLSLDGKGPIAERQFVGTGFVIGENGTLITNRHVGLPWEHDVNVEVLAGKHLEPRMIKFLAYLPGITQAEGVELIRTSDKADVAILRFESAEVFPKGLLLGEKKPDAGDEVIVMGYPTGMRSMLAQAGEGFIKELQAAKEFDFWDVAARLAEAGRIVPLASRGIVGQVSNEIIAYDAETTHGGSGGPVLNMNGKVVAVNAAILPEYGGSNLGVPIGRVREMIGESELK
jgi:S1-C subfamily serine protease